MIEKRILAPDRVRRPPQSGFSWVDRRFLREFSSRLSHDGIVLYLFLAAVSDKHGLSFYRDSTIAVRLRTREQTIVCAREELILQDLIAYRPPLTQVLSLPRPGRTERSGLHGLAELMRPSTPHDSLEEGI
jgi:hypothetical protein